MTSLQNKFIASFLISLLAHLIISNDSYIFQIVKHQFCLFVVYTHLSVCQLMWITMEG